MADAGNRARVYIDGFNFYYAAFRDGTFGRWKWLDLVAFSRCLVPGLDVDHVRYFTARVKPSADDPDADIRQGIYLNALGTLNHLSVHFGTFKRRQKTMRLAPPPKQGRMEGVVYLEDPVEGEYGTGTSLPDEVEARPTRAYVMTTEEKGSDVNLATYLLRDAFKGLYDTAVVLSDDSDLLEPVKLVQKELGSSVIVAKVPRKSDGKKSRRASVFDGKVKYVREVREAYLRDSQLPVDIVGRDGKLISRPAAWGPAGN